MIATGAKPFMIDHPADPANKYLKHFALESDEVLNVYRGTIMLDGAGKATVTLPDYVELVNIDFSYQLTGIGPPVHPYIESEISSGFIYICWCSKLEGFLDADRRKK